MLGTDLIYGRSNVLLANPFLICVISCFDKILTDALAAILAGLVATWTLTTETALSVATCSNRPTQVGCVSTLVNVCKQQHCCYIIYLLCISRTCKSMTGIDADISLSAHTDVDHQFYQSVILLN